MFGLHCKGRVHGTCGKRCWVPLWWDICGVLVEKRAWGQCCGTCSGPLLWNMGGPCCRTRSRSSSPRLNRNMCSSLPPRDGIGVANISHKMSREHVLYHGLEHASQHGHRKATSPWSSNTSHNMGPEPVLRIGPSKRLTTGSLHLTGCVVGCTGSSALLHRMK